MYIEKEVVEEGVVLGVNEFLEDHDLSLDYEQERALIEYITEAVYTRLVEDEDYTDEEEPGDLQKVLEEGF